MGIATADCGPVLFADDKAGVVGAAHAGWRGATGRVLENTITAMEDLGANRENITAVLGPTIAQASYEVGPEFVENLLKLGDENAIYFPSQTTMKATPSLTCPVMSPTVSQLSTSAPSIASTLTPMPTNNVSTHFAAPPTAVKQTMAAY